MHRGWRVIKILEIPVDEIIPLAKLRDVVVGSVAGADYGDLARDEPVVAGVGDEVAVAEGLERFDDGGPCGGAGGLDVDPEVEGLQRVDVKDPAGGLAGEDFEEGVDVQ